MQFAGVSENKFLIFVHYLLFLISVMLYSRRGAYSRAALINFLSQMRHLIKGGAYSSKINTVSITCALLTYTSVLA